VKEIFEDAESVSQKRNLLKELIRIKLGSGSAEVGNPEVGKWEPFSRPSLGEGWELNLGAKQTVGDRGKGISSPHITESPSFRDGAKYQ